MTNFITNNDFEGQVYKVFSGGDNATEFLNEIIEATQQKVLKQILGNIEYYNLDQDLISGVPQTTKWLNFVNGVDYTDANGVHYDYKGIKPVLIRMTYYYWQEQTRSILAESGELILKNPNSSVKIIPYEKMIHAYNEAVDLIQGNDVYAATVYKYLSDNTFDDWYFTRFKKLNLFGI